jgi:hypothetical protein
MAQARTRRQTPRQAQQQAAVEMIARDRVLLQVLEEFGPQSGDAHLEYRALLARVIAVLTEEQRRLDDR